MKTQNISIIGQNHAATACENLVQPSRLSFAGFGLKRFSATCLEKLHELKEVITANLAAEFADTLHPRTVQQVVNEADALAASTPFPALFLPILAEEKVLVASQWQARQRQIRDRFLSFAA